MSSDPDPHASAPLPVDDAARDRFSRRFLGFAIRGKEEATTKSFTDRRADVVKQAAAGIARLHDEFTRVPLKNYDAMSDEERIAELKKVFPHAPIAAVPGSTNISINGVLEMDPTSLRQLEPHKRDEVFAAAALKTGSDEQIAALKEVSDKYRLRSEKDAADGKAHLQGIAVDAQKATLGRLFDEDPKNHAGAFRAFDISNKLKGPRQTAEKTKKPADIQKYEDAVQKQSAMLAMALSMNPGTLSEMVVNFEFAEMSFDGAVKSRADAIAQKEAEEKRDAEARDRRLQLDKVDDLKRANKAEALELAALKTKLGGLLDEDFKKLSKDDRPKVIDYNKRVKELQRQKDIADSLTLEKIEAFERDEVLYVVTAAHKEAATKSFVSEMTGPESAERTATIEKLNKTLTAYTAAVPATGNDGGTADVTQNMADVTLNAAEAVKVAKSLRFSDNKTAGYHTMKHHNAIAKDASFAAYKADNTVENEVAHYHDRARTAVTSGEIVLSHIEQNGGEGHHFKHGSLTAIVKMAKNKAGIATFF